MLRAASRATAVSVCVPSGTVIVFHEMEYGAVVSSAPRLAPSTLNCTPGVFLLRHLIIDRCYVHGDPDVAARRGVDLNSKHTAIVDSYFSDWKEPLDDAQAIAGWNGPGPYKIVNNYLEASGENVMFGGDDPTITNLVPSDIEIRLNYMPRRLGGISFVRVHAGVRSTN